MKTLLEERETGKEHSGLLHPVPCISEVRIACMLAKRCRAPHVRRCTVWIRAKDSIRTSAAFLFCSCDRKMFPAPPRPDISYSLGSALDNRHTCDSSCGALVRVDEDRLEVDAQGSKWV